jgi:hypothetical protein
MQGMVWFVIRTCFVLLTLFFVEYHVTVCPETENWDLYRRL